METFGIILIIIVYLLFGRVFGYEVYREEIMDFYLQKIQHMYVSPDDYEKNIRPKFFRNILRIISILIWPVFFVGWFIITLLWLIKLIIVGIFKFFLD